MVNVPEVCRFSPFFFLLCTSYLTFATLSFLVSAHAIPDRNVSAVVYPLVKHPRPTTVGIETMAEVALVAHTDGERSSGVSFELPLVRCRSDYTIAAREDQETHLVSFCRDALP